MAESPDNEAVQRQSDQRIADLEREVAELRRQVSNANGAQFPISTMDEGRSDDPDGAESPPCMEVDGEMRLSPDVVAIECGKSAWRWNKKEKCFENAWVILGREAHEIPMHSGSNVNIETPGDYYVHVYHPYDSTRIWASCEIVSARGTNTYTDTYIWVATLAADQQSGVVRQTKGLYSAPVLPIYAI